MLGLGPGYQKLAVFVSMIPGKFFSESRNLTSIFTNRNLNPEPPIYDSSPNLVVIRF